MSEEASAGEEVIQGSAAERRIRRIAEIFGFQPASIIGRIPPWRDLMIPREGPPPWATRFPKLRHSLSKERENFGLFNPHSYRGPILFRLGLQSPGSKNLPHIIAPKEGTFSFAVDFAEEANL